MGQNETSEANRRGETPPPAKPPYGNRSNFDRLHAIWADDREQAVKDQNEKIAKHFAQERQQTGESESASQKDASCLAPDTKSQPQKP